MLTVSVLGPVEARRAGEPIPIPAGRTSELLVRLALEAGTMVRTDRLIDDLWGDEAVRTTRNTLQSKIAKLRRALGDATAVVATDGGYLLAIDAADVDALAVIERAATATALLDAGDTRGAADVCAKALRLFRGELLVSAGEGEWVVPHRTRLEAARLQLIEVGASVQLRLGDPDGVIGELEMAVATYPYQEGLWALLITALYQAGRQAAALQTFQSVRRQLADDLGLDPGPQLRQLEQQILSHDSTIEPLRPPLTVGRIVGSGNLPSISAELVGRDEQIASIASLLAEHRLVEIVGPGGIGKTACAVATGRAWAESHGANHGGVWLARLETAVTADEVVDTLIAALNVVGGTPALYERLRGTDALIILDNCEHVVDAAADLTTRLLDASPELRVLCTSQVPLDIDGETLFELPPLALDDATALFARRATAQRRGLRLAADDGAVRDLCRALDGLPLAIELAAVRTRTLSIGEISRRLDDRFAVLNDPTSRRPERRRALRATIGWSYELLFPDDRRGLWALATFAGGASLSAVEAVIEALGVPAETAIDVVDRLVARSLVIVDGDDANRPVRYRLLDSVRAFALEAMAEAVMSGTAHAAHAAWFARAADSSTAGVRSTLQADYLAVARAERANIDAALAWAVVHDPLLALRLASGFGWAWIVLGDSRGAQRLLAALDAAETASAAQRATALLLAGWIEASTGDLAPARAHVTTASELAEAIADVDLLARSSYYLAYVVSHDGEFRRALELTDRSRALYEGLDRAWDQAANGLFAARAAISAGDEPRSVEASIAVEHWLSVVDDPWLHARGEAMLGELARLQHRFDDAVIHIRRAVETSGRLGFLQTEAYQTSSLGRAQCQAGDYDAGAATLAQAIDKAEATGDARLATLARVHLGRVLRAMGDVGSARVALEAASAWHRAAGGGEQALLGDCLLSAIDAADDIPGAAERLDVILEAACRNDAAHVEVFALDALANLAARHGDVDSARVIGERADQRMHAASHFITDRDRTDAHARR